MTICIAALAENGNGLVLCSDNMITAHIPTKLEFETNDMRKIYALTDKSYILSAGDALAANEIIIKAQEDVNKKSITNITLSTNEVAEIIRKAYSNYRINIAIQHHVETRALDINTYYANHKALKPNIVSEIDYKLKNYDIGVDLIFAGKITNEKNRIFYISHPGITTVYDEIGYLCIGSGSPYASYHFIENDYKKSMKKEDIEKLVKAAKERSQKAPGVGIETKLEIV